MFSQNQIELLESRGLETFSGVAVLCDDSSLEYKLVVKPTSKGYTVKNGQKVKYVKTFYNVLDEIDKIK